MKNWEKFENELKEIGFNFAVGKQEKRPRKCALDDLFRCDMCIFFTPELCTKLRIEWLYEDYTEKPKLTKRERMFCELAGKGCIARDRNDIVWFHTGKPKKYEEEWIGGMALFNVRDYLNLQFDFIKWSDPEPWSVEDLLKLEVEE